MAAVCTTWSRRLRTRALWASPGHQTAKRSRLKASHPTIQVAEASISASSPTTVLSCCGSLPAALFSAGLNGPRMGGPFPSSRSKVVAEILMITVLLLSTPIHARCGPLQTPTPSLQAQPGCLTVESQSSAPSVVGQRVKMTLATALLYETRRQH